MSYNVATPFLLNRDGVSDDIHLFNQKLREWEDYYKYAS